MQTHDNQQERQHSRAEWIYTLGSSAVALFAMGFIAYQAPGVLLALMP
ncbi:hypothetical protein FBY21_1668 [Pseudomonas sp. SLBN-26]|nr:MULTISPECIES: hypothetical protein [Gammaproteobacteria]MDL5600498.1 hypothetical protein [Bacillus subtilis]MBO2927227.1 hypothetical protein [Pseudomonas otitidis]MCP1617068.1 hypothetical protein [Pseudomonas otitidis]MDU9395434.1 hypothetical protein [Pseudomonas sp. zfem003]TQL06310.1 hypothetical protein FBY21_1668 [Pseudomonas sp. SLBN-26]